MAIIPLLMDYNIHIISRDYIFLWSTKKKMLSYQNHEVFNKHLSDLFVPSEWITVKKKIDLVFSLNKSEFIVYCLKDYAFLSLLVKINNFKVAVHEVLDDFNNRHYLKKKIWAAATNFHWQYYKKNIG